jgi:hypothetical protein
MIQKILNVVFGCRHKRLTRPITPVHRPGAKAGDTYVACLSCGKRFYYDAARMQIGTAMPLPRASYRPLDEFQVQ